ncbi:MAG: sterol desaturase family protein [bacterium]
MRRFYTPELTRKDDIWIEIIGTASFILVIAPGIFYLVPYVMEYFFPNSKNAWAELSWWQMVLILLVADEMTHYWWHRACHEIPLLYNLHRAHHSSQYMSVRLAYRNNLFFFLLMPNLWAAAILLHLGFGPVYAVYVIIKMTVNFCSHSPIGRWDAVLYRYKILSPFVWGLERVITTPAAHAAHHGQHKEDGITNYKGNYANLFFFWDVLFGTAKLSRDYPQEYGIENIPAKSWKHEMFWPLWRDKS